MTGVNGPAGMPADDGSWTDFFNPSRWIEQAGTGIMDKIATSLGQAAKNILNGVWWAISGSTSPRVDADFLHVWLGRTAAISLPLMVIFMVLQAAMTAVRNRGAGGFGRILIGGVSGVVGTYLMLPLVGLLVGLFDTLALGLADKSSGDVGALVDQITGFLLGDGNEAQAVGGGVLAAMGSIVVGILVVIGAVTVWLALLIRMILIYVVLVIGPFAIAGVVWEPTRRWIRQWWTLVVALLFTKLGVVLVFGLGASMIASLDFGGDTFLTSLGQLFGGLILLLLAALVPVACFKFFSFLGESGASAIHDGGQVAAGKGAAMVRGAAKPANVLRRGQSDSSPTSGGGPSSRPGRAPQSLNGSPRSPGGAATPSTAGASAGSSPSGASPSAAGAGGAVVGAGYAAARGTADRVRSAGVAAADRTTTTMDDLAGSGTARGNSPRTSERRGGSSGRGSGPRPQATGSAGTATSQGHAKPRPLPRPGA